MTIFICISFYVREMFRFKQISSHFPSLMFAFSDGAAEIFFPIMPMIITQLLTLTNSATLTPLPTNQPPTGIGLSLGSGRVIGPRRHAQANDSRVTALGLYIAVLSVSQQQHNVYSLHINITLLT